MTVSHVAMNERAATARGVAPETGLSATCRHDIRNVLAGLDLMIDAVADVRDGARRAALARRLRRCHDRLVALCLPDAAADAEDALAIATVGEAIANVHDVLTPALPASVRLAVHCPDGLASPVPGEALFRILLNLVGNAGRATARAGGGTVSVVVRRIDGVVLIDVVDEGAGFEAAPPHAGSGGGLGVVIATTLAERHGGRVHLVETGRVGSRVRVMFETG